ncbi:MAG: hypothetical protein ABIJ09_02390 [Pseudomonadota bacterium]
MKNISIFVTVGLLGALLSALGCPDQPAPASVCEQGATRACSCLESTQGGEQRCLDDLTGWSRCVCPPDQDAGIVDAALSPDRLLPDASSPPDATASDAGANLQLRGAAMLAPVSGSTSGGSLHLRGTLRSGAAPASSGGGDLHLDHLGLAHE